MKKIIIAIALFCTAQTKAQVGIGTITPDASAQLDISSSTKGLLISRLTDLQRIAISSPAEGLLVYQTTAPAGIYVFRSGSWQVLHAGVLTVDNGGTGSSTKNFVDLSSDQVIEGKKDFNNNVTIAENLGIGTSTPDNGYRVDIHGGNMRLKGGENNRVTLNLSGLSGSNWGLGTDVRNDGGNNFYLEHGGCCTRLVMDDYGNLALGGGFQNPQGLFHARNEIGKELIFNDGKLQVIKNDVGMALTHTLENRNDPEANQGSAMGFYGGSNGSAPLATIGAAWNDASDANAYLSLSTVSNNTLSEKMRISSNGTVTANAFNGVVTGLKKVIDDEPNFTLGLTNAGQVIFTQWGEIPSFPEDLPNGFNCEIVNYSNYTWTSNTLSVAKFFSRLSGWNNSTGTANFSIKSGGTVKINVVTLNSVKCYFIAGDIE